MKNFAKKIYRVVARIPRGKVLTYGEVARRAGVPGAARLVGNMMAKNPSWPDIPCHRVVRADGFVGRWSGRGGRNKKINLLRKEGFEIRRGRIVF